MSGQTSRLSTLSPGSGQGESLHLVHGLCLLEFFDLGPEKPTHNRGHAPKDTKA